eukprot:1808688-Prorocentrum_lima.AAC.1
MVATSPIAEEEEPPTEVAGDRVMGPPQQAHSGAMSSSMAWQPPATQGDVFVQGIIHIDEAQPQNVRYEAVRE